MAFGTAYIAGSWPLQWGIFLAFLMSCTYSMKLPFMRWKEQKLSAALLIPFCRGIILQLSTFLHIQNIVLKRQAHFSRPLAFALIVVSMFGVVIAICKDVPDIEGDKKYGFHSFAASLGGNKVFKMSVYLLEMVYIFAILFGATSSHPWSKLITMVSHAIFALFLWKQTKSLDPKSDFSYFYMLLWKLLCAEFLIIPFVR